MKRIVLGVGVVAAFAAVIAVFLSGCGGGGYYAREAPGDQMAPTSPSATVGMHPGRAPAPAADSRAPDRPSRGGGGGGAGAPAPAADAGAPGRRLALALPGEEVWVITKPPRAADQARPAPDATPEMPGTGTIAAQVPVDGQMRLIPIPLKHTEVKASIAGYIAAVDVTQQFHNPYSGKIEAVYVFPLPHNAAVSEFVMTIGERRIRGIIRERQEAERLYAEARRQGYVASLLTQERPNIFTQKVANLEPGKQIDVNIRYYHTLAYDDGWYEWVFPMVVGPRYNPGGSTDGVGAVGRGSTGVSGQRTEVSYLKPTERSGHDIAVTVEVNAGVPIEEVVCNSHQLDLSPTALTAAPASDAARAPTSRFAARLHPQDTIPNKDLVLRYRVAGDKVKSSLVMHRDDRGGFFTLMILPPQDLKALPREPMEMVFLLDCSGSMSGDALNKVKAAMDAALHLMDRKDSFQICCFANSAYSTTPQPVSATDDNLRSAADFVRGLNAGGGTEMLSGVRAALARSPDAERRRLVALLTDGFIGNEKEVIAEVAGKRGGTRFFSFGIGASPNRHLIEGVARMGGGAMAYVGLRDQADQVMRQYLERVSHPALTDISIDFGGMNVSSVYPRRLPDLFVGRPVVITGRFTSAPTRPITVTGRAGGQTLSFPVALVADGDAPPASDFAAARALPALWARMFIADLSDQLLQAADPHRELEQQIKLTALEFGLMSPYTAFIAVDSTARTAGDHGTTVPVPVSVPEGTRYDTTVQE